MDKSDNYDTIQCLIAPYFEFLHTEFKELTDEVTKRNISPKQLSQEYIANNIFRKKFILKTRPKIINFIQNFWQKNNTSILTKIKSLKGTKTVWESCITTQTDSSMITRPALYFDTIILPDPLFKLINLPDDIMEDCNDHILRHGIQLSLLSDLFLSGNQNPIVVLISDFEIDDSFKPVIYNMWDSYIVQISNE